MMYLDVVVRELEKWIVLHLGFGVLVMIVQVNELHQLCKLVETPWTSNRFKIELL